MKTYQVEINYVTNIVRASSKKEAKKKFEKNAKIKINLTDIYLYPIKIKNNKKG